MVSYKVSIFNYRLLFLLAILLVTGCKNEKGSSGDLNPLAELSPDEIEENLNDSKSRLSQPEAVGKFYTSREFAPAWANNKARNSFIEILIDAKSQGLNFEDYHGKELEAFLFKPKELEEEDLAKLDVLLTDAFLHFGQHLWNGKTDPTKLHEIWEIPRKEIDLPALLASAVQENNIVEAIDKLKPTHPVYAQLVSAEKEYSKLKEKGVKFTPIPDGETLKPGMKDGRIQAIQFRLMELGYLENVSLGGVEYSGETVDAIKEFQHDHGLEVDGNIGNDTISLLNISYEDRYQQILVNLERWRWYPREFGDHYILVNIANYDLQVVKEGDTIRSHKVMVGTDVRKTPVFTDEIEYIVFNPSWNIPPTIQSKDVIPGVRKNSEYLASRNIEVLNQQGDKLDPSGIDWSSSEVNSFRFRQPPGSSNPLGRVKIIYPNKHLIYLHDTPSKELFNSNERAESSGCIRVEGVLDLAKYLLEGKDGYSSELVDSLIVEGKTKEVKVDQKVKIYHLYWTVWKENGETRFTKDIYDYDDKIYKALTKA